MSNIIFINLVERTIFYNSDIQVNAVVLKDKKNLVFCFALLDN